MNKYNKIKAILKRKEDWDYLGVKIAIRLVFKDGRYNAQLVYSEISTTCQPVPSTHLVLLLSNVKNSQPNTLLC